MDDTLRSNTGASQVPGSDPVESARSAGLRYVTDSRPGIARIRRGSGFVYRLPDGKPVRDEQTLARITALAIPPAWTDVWISPDPQGHLQATGRDARGRKQYRYHPTWRQARDETKYDRIIAFARTLPKIRRRVQRDLRRSGLTREKVLAAIVQLLETTLIRVGNDEYARHNDSFGLTTFRDRHATVNGSTVRFRFRGKRGIPHEVDLKDARLARIVRRCQDLPGYELFQYIDEEGNVCDVGSADVNEYLRQICGEDFTAKEFRTWAGTVLAAMALRELGGFSSQRQATRHILLAVQCVARQLGNTAAVCRKCYIHPAVIDAYLDRSLARSLEVPVAASANGSSSQLLPHERAVLQLLAGRS